MIRLHDPASGAVQRQVEEHTGKIQALSFNKEKTLMITGSADCNSKLRAKALLHWIPGAPEPTRSRIGVV